jgi:hypothetical protein
MAILVLFRVEHFHNEVKSNEKTILEKFLQVCEDIIVYIEKCLDCKTVVTTFKDLNKI